MSKKNKNKKLKKTLVEKMLDQKKIPYEQVSFATVQQGDVKQMDTSILDEDEHLVYKTLVCEGNKISPIVGVIPITEHLSMKKLAKASGNKKCELLPLKKLVATTGYVHGANTPIGIYEQHHFPIYLDKEMLDHDQIIVSSGEVGRSIKINPKQLQKITEADFVDLIE
ncbi:Cys-tRNA(Pro)/Cys-tRNA(Cys) deacylase [Lactobacillus colini]|uniref:Cys-tRNA(Pro)/Cys-tRNA(Cys) deacylase n=1 Tax=Lactobacillus colini TaxID=1819254 RepID=A0ABS4MBI7_9LACO|nr:aminoacyl-tRNA deacylase [Lactobacillus colini]MBP2057040.1 Cys-tRNA(Pro)/Cys-tRNA(Cys) deacylase [Lactobacillus colini]